jgi:hypothetical protein
MINSTWKLATVLGVVGAISFSAASAEARTKRKVSNTQGAVATAPATVPQRSLRGSFNFAAPPAGNYINYGDGRLGANYNPNQ